MASPFTVFRKNQKALLVAATLAAILAFVFGDAFTRFRGRDGQQENPVVVQTKYGSLNESEMVSIRQSRDLVDLFLRAVSQETVNAQIQGGMIDARMQDRAFDQWYGYWRQRLLHRSAQGAEEAAVETLVLSKKAEQLGMVVSDQAIEDTLIQITGNALSSDTVQAIVTQLQTGRRVTRRRLFDAMRPEILASRLSELFRVSLSDVPPAQRFEYFSRINRRAKIEVLPLAVADFTSQIADPKPEVLTKFFDEHKDSFPNPDSPVPGFKEPKRAAFQYFKADFARFKEEFKPKVTEDEIREYYEKNKAQFRAADLPADHPASSGGAEPASGEKPADPAADATPASDKPADEKPAEGKPADEKPATDPPAQDKPADEKPADEKPAAEPKADDQKPAEPQANQSSRPIDGGRQGKARFLLVSANLADDEKPAEPAAETAAPAQDAASATQDAASDAKPVSEASATPAADKPATEPAATETPATEPAATEPAATDAAAPQDAKPGDAAAAPKEEPRYEPLEKVQESIRDSLAGQKANQQIGEIFEKLSAEMRRYADELDAYNATKGTSTATKPPKPFPFKELAQANQVIAKETDLITAAEATSGTDLGQITRTVADRRSQFGFRLEPFSEFAFSDLLLVYRPTTEGDNEGNSYLFWKTKEQAAYVPKLDQIHDQVVAAWKLIEAREPAKKRAEEYAQQARAAKEPLKAFFAKQENLKVVETGAFTWLSSGNVPFDPTNSGLRLSPVDGVEHPGDAFMSTVFDLAPGDVGVSTNVPENMVYVVRMVEFEPSLEDLRNEFASEKQMRYMPVAQAEQRDMYLAWLSDLNKEANVHWIRKADLATQRRAAATTSDLEDE